MSVYHSRNGRRRRTEDGLPLLEQAYRHSKSKKKVKGMCLHSRSPSVSLFIIPPICQLPLLNHLGDAEGGRAASLMPYGNF